MPDLRTDEEKLRFLLQVKRYVPNLFDDAAKYNFSLMKLLDSQADLQKKMAADPAFAEAIRRASNFTEITVRPASSGMITSEQIAPAAVARWRSDLLNALAGIPTAGEFSQTLPNYLRSLQASLAGRTSSGLITGILEALPAAQKAAGFKQPNDAAKLAFIRQHLPKDTAIPESLFRHGFGEHSSWDDVLRAVSERAGIEQKLTRAVELHLLLQSEDGQIHLNLAEAKARLQNLGVNDLVALNDKRDFFMPRFKAMQKGLKLPGRSLTQAGDRVVSEAAQHASERVKVQQRIGKGIRLTEVPPAVGLFRGCVGGDCSSQYSFPYPNAPNERIYFVYADTPAGADPGPAKGYVTATIVELDGKPALRVTTIAGPRMGADEAALAIHGLHQQLPHLSTPEGTALTAIILPPKSEQARLLNFEPIRNMIGSMVEGQPEIKLTFPDAAARSVIEAHDPETNSGDYDHMNRNNTGVVYEPSRGPIADLRVETARAARTWALVDTPPVELRRQSLLFGLDLFHSGRARDARRALAAVKPPLNVDGVVELWKLMHNAERLKIDDFNRKTLEMANRLARKSGIPEFDQSFFAEKEIILRDGWFLAPDALDSRHLGNTVDQLVKGLKRDPDTYSDSMLKLLRDPAAMAKVNAYRGSNGNPLHNWFARLAGGTDQEFATYCEIKTRLMSSGGDFLVEGRPIDEALIGRMRSGAAGLRAGTAVQVLDHGFDPQSPVHREAFGTMRELIGPNTEAGARTDAIAGLAKLERLPPEFEAPLLQNLRSEAPVNPQHTRKALAALEHPPDDLWRLATRALAADDGGASVSGQMQNAIARLIQKDDPRATALLQRIFEGVGEKSYRANQLIYMLQASVDSARVRSAMLKAMDSPAVSAASKAAIIDIALRFDADADRAAAARVAARLLRGTDLGLAREIAGMTVGTSNSMLKRELLDIMRSTDPALLGIKAELLPHLGRIIESKSDDKELTELKKLRDRVQREVQTGAIEAGLAGCVGAKVNGWLLRFKR